MKFLLQTLKSDINFSIKISDITTHLKCDIDKYDEDREGQVEEEPDLHRLDVGGAGETGGHGQVDRGQHHHAGDVDGVDQVVLGVSGDVVGGLVDNVHQDGGQVGHHEDTFDLPGQNHRDLGQVSASFLIK